MKRTIFILALFLSAPIYAANIDHLRNSELNLPNIQNIQKVEAPSLPAPAKELEATTPEQCAILAEMTARSLRTIALTLQGLENAYDKNRAPEEFTFSVNHYTNELLCATKGIHANLKSKTYQWLFINSVRVRKYSKSLKKKLELIEGHENYDYWFGPNIESSAEELENLMNKLKKLTPEYYSFVKPELKNPLLKEDWGKFVNERIQELKRWEKLYLAGRITYNDFKSLVNGAVSLKETWELYQESTLQNKSGDKFIKACFLKKIEKDTCVYKCSGGTTYVLPIERPFPNFDNEPSIVCPQIVFPF